MCPDRRGEFYYIGGKSLCRAESDSEGSSYVSRPAVHSLPRLNVAAGKLTRCPRRTARRAQTYEHTRLDYVPNCIGVGCVFPRPLSRRLVELDLRPDADVPSLPPSFEHLALAGPKSELTLLPLRRLPHLSSPAIHTRLPYPASINNSLFVSHSSHLALPLAPATGTPRPPWGGSEGIRVGVSNNDGSVRVMGVERNETPRAGDLAEELRIRKKKVLNMVGEVEIPVSVNHCASRAAAPVGPDTG